MNLDTRFRVLGGNIRQQDFSYIARKRASRRFSRQSLLSLPLRTRSVARPSDAIPAVSRPRPILRSLKRLQAARRAVAGLSLWNNLVPS